MHIIIENFRCHERLEFEVPDNAMARLEGDSGQGKSTVLEAIYWLLYGKVQGIYDNRTETKTRPQVYLNLNQLQILRQANPNYLKVIYNQVEYIGDAAQSFIDLKFSSHDLWVNSCYIKQRNRCEFFNLTGKEKLKLLNDLTFQGLDIQADTKKIEDYYKKLQESFKEEQIVYTTKLNIFQHRTSQQPFNLQYTNEHLNQYTTYLSNCQEQLKQYTNLAQLEEQKKGKRASLANQQDKYVTDLEELKKQKVEVDDLLTLETKINLLDYDLTKLKAQEPLNQKLLALIVDDNLATDPYTYADYQKAKEIEYKFQTEFLPLEQKISQTKVNPAIDLQINGLNELLKFKEAESAYHKYLDLEQKLASSQPVEINPQMTWEIYHASIYHTQQFTNVYQPLKAKLDLLAVPKYDIADLTYDQILKVKSLEQDYEKWSKLDAEFKALNLSAPLVQSWTTADQYKLEQNLAKQSQLSKLKEALNGYTYDSLEPLTDAKLYELEAQDAAFQKEQPLLAKYQYKYSKQSLPLLEQEIKYLNLKPLVDEFKKLSSLQRDKESLINARQNYTFLLELKQQQLHDLKLSQESLHCPNCQHALLLKDKKLIKFESQVETSNLSQVDLEQSIIRLKRLVQLEEALKDIDLTLNVENLNLADLNVIKTFKFVEPIQTNLSQAKLYLSYLKLKDQFQEPVLATADIGLTHLKYFDLQDKLAKFITNVQPNPSSQELEQILAYNKIKAELDALSQNNYNRLPKFSPEQIKAMVEYNELVLAVQQAKVDKPLYPYADVELYYYHQLDVAKLEALKQLGYQQLPATSSTLIQKIMDNNKIREERSVLAAQGAQPVDLKPQIASLTADLNTLKSQVNQLKVYQERLTWLTKNLDQVNLELDNLVLDPQIIAYKQQLEQAVQQSQVEIQNIKYALEMVGIQKELELKYQQNYEMMLDIGAAQDLYKHAIEVECNHLQQTVDKLNRVMNMIFQQIFNYTIKVKLKLFKEVKSTGKNKAEVNLSINYKGAKYTKIKDLSGGEGDRISFGLILALNLISPSPILLLDECTNSLNDDYRESCIETARKYLSHKTIFMISHQDVEGWYDHIVKF